MTITGADSSDSAPTRGAENFDILSEEKIDSLMQVVEALFGKEKPPSVKKPEQKEETLVADKEEEKRD